MSVISKKLIRQADMLFSKVVKRLNTDMFGICHCCVCGDPMTIEEAECGHYQSRGNYLTRWNINNALPECHTCNSDGYNHFAEFIEKIDLRFGDGTAQNMRDLARQRFRMDDMFIKNVIKDLEQLLKTLE